jgi:hypothetical protein
MKIEQDRVFREQAEHYRLRFNCEDCGLFDAEREACVHGFPTTEHRAAYYRDPDSRIVFCKHFELG